MIEQSDVVKLDEDDLCTFRFTALPRERTSGFTFPVWSALSVADPSEEEDRMYKENDLIRHGQEVSVLQMNSKEAARTAAAEDNVVFMTTNIRIDKNLPPVTVEKLDIKRCSDTRFRKVGEDGSVHQIPYMSFQAYPSFAIYLDAERRRPIPSQPTPAGGEIALWKNEKWVQLRMTSSWIQAGEIPTLIGSLLTFEYAPQVDVPYGRIGERIMAYTTCKATITR
jgi:hypothetical protein